jgi:hypothetical protein
LADQDKTSDVLDLVDKAHNAVIGELTRLGIGVSPLMFQVLFLALSIAALFLLRKRLFPLKEAQLDSAIPAILLALAWISQTRPTFIL